ncbi:FG-GAP-like repeat-containing protein, partial [Indibacter alkaliphilus]|uniref:FG-GAP-like repeat-containing protein n=1 Tax=Indibacter alkaliphilus TaxID=579922 RepID=UPI00058E9083
VFCCKSKGKVNQFHEHYPVRGYKSFVEPIAHFGMGSKASDIQLSITWPDGKKQFLKVEKLNSLIELNYKDALIQEEEEGEINTFSYQEVAESLGISHNHEHLIYNDFNRQVLLPHKHSENGPGIAVGDINGDGLDDFFVSASAGFPRFAYIQNNQGMFTKKEIFTESEIDDMGCLLLDIDGDGDLDLYVVSGGSRSAEGDKPYQDRLYLNDGKGNFDKYGEGIPYTDFSGSVVTAADITGDGNFEFFIGGRVKPGQYPLPQKSLLLGFSNGSFHDLTDQMIPDLQELGMVSAALWTDFDQDGLLDLIVVGEWMPITFFKQYKTDGQPKFENISHERGPEGSTGWWNSLYPIGTDENGNPQYILGNAGINTRWQVNSNTPLIMIADDFDQNKSIDPILFTQFTDGMYPAAGRDKMVSQVPSWKNRFLAYSEYAKYDLESFFTPEQQREALTLKTETFESALLKIDSTGRFSLSPLAMEAQFAPTFGINFDYVDDKLFLIGNFYGNETETGRYDASIGNVLEANSEGKFNTNIQNTGFLVEGEGRALVNLTLANNQSLILASQHQGPIKAFKKSAPYPNQKYLKLARTDFKVSFELIDGTFKSLEFPYGAGYLSQSSRKIPIPSNCKTIQITEFDGTSRLVTPDQIQS